MSDTIVVAIIGLVGSGLGSLIGVIASSKLTQYRIQKLEEQVNKHNNLVFEDCIWYDKGTSCVARYNLIEGENLSA